MIPRSTINRSVRVSIIRDSFILHKKKEISCTLVGRTSGNNPSQEKSIEAIVVVSIM